MKKSKLYHLAQIAVVTTACIAPERKLDILRVLIADEDLEKFIEEQVEKKNAETV